MVFCQLKEAAAIFRTDDGVSAAREGIGEGRFEIRVLRQTG
jgi:hypothetical protein